MGHFDDLIDPAPTAPVATPVATGSSAPASELPTPTADATELESDSTSGEADTVTHEESTDDAAADSDESADVTDDNSPVPDAIANRPATPTLRTRFDSHSILNDQLRADWIKSIQLSPDAFDALMFRAMSTTDVVIGDDGYEATSAQKIDPNQETLHYADPELVAIVDCPDQMAEFYAMNDTDENTGVQDDALILRIAAHDITIGTILEWNEALANGEHIRRWWYVHRKFNYGTAAVGTLYYCVPSRSYEGMLDE
jgi:hypothetical protein